MWPTPAAIARASSSSDLVVAVHGDLLGRHAGRQRHRQLAAGADVDAEAFVAHPAQHGAGAERLGRVEHPPAGPNAPVYSRHRDRTSASSHTYSGVPNSAARSRTSAPPQRQHAAGAPRAARPDAAVQGVQVVRRDGRMVGGQHVAMAWPGRVRDAAHLYPLWRADADQPEAGSQPSARRVRQPQPFAADVQHRRETSSAHGVNRPRCQPSRYPANSSGRPRRAAMATRSGSQDSASSSASSCGPVSRRGWNAGWLWSQRGGPAQHGGSGGMRVPNSIGGIDQHVPRDDRRLRRDAARRHPGQREPDRVRPA